MFATQFLSNSDQIRYSKSINDMKRSYLFNVDNTFPDTVQKALTMLNGLVKQNLITRRNTNQGDDRIAFVTDGDS